MDDRVLTVEVGLGEVETAEPKVRQSAEDASSVRCVDPDPGVEVCSRSRKTVGR